MAAVPQAGRCVPLRVLLRSLVNPPTFVLRQRVERRKASVPRPLQLRRSGMWAQLITTRLKPGRENDLPKLIEQLQAAEQPHSGFLRATAMQDQKDPSRVYML